MQRRFFCLLILLANINVLFWVGFFFVVWLVFFSISLSWNSPFCIYTFYQKLDCDPSIWVLTKLLCLKLHPSSLQFCISLDLYSIYFFLALKATVPIDALPSETASSSCFQPQSILDIAIPQYGVKGRMIYYLSHWGKVLIFVWNSQVLQDNFKYIYNFFIKSCRNYKI